MLRWHACYRSVVVVFLVTSLASVGDGKRPPRSVAGRVPGLPSYVTVDGFNMARDGLRPMYTAPDENSRLPGKYVVVMKETSDSDAVQHVMGKYKSTVLTAQNEGRRRGHPDVTSMFHMTPVAMEMNVLKGFVAEMTPNDVLIMRTMSDVEYVEEDQVFEMQQSAVPWHLDRIDQQDLPLDGRFNTQPVSETPECPDGYQLFGEACYKAFDEVKNYSSAEAACATDGGIVAEPRNRAVNDFLSKIKTSLNPFAKFWLGLTDREKEGTWRWNDGEALDGNSFTNWADGEPNQAGNEYCAVVEADSKWNDVSCRLSYRFICQRPALGPTFVPTDGASVDVYIVDSGIRYSHEEFEGRADWSGFDAFDADGSNKGNDLYGHGTHVAALVGGKTFGVNPRVLLRSVRVLNHKGLGSMVSVLSGINHIYDNITANSPARGVVVMSLSSKGVTQSVNEASRRLVLQGLPVVVAAGNAGDDACTRSPAGEAEVITVGGTRKTDHLYDHVSGATAHGSCVDIFAPAQEVLSAGAECDSCSEIRSGTSMAAPITAGVVTKLLSRDPSMTPAQIRMALLSAAASDKLDFSSLPKDSLLKTPNKLLQLPEVPLGETAGCRTVWSVKSDPEKGSPVAAACNVNETLLSCSSVTDGVHTGGFPEFTNGRQICVANNGEDGSSVYALARCCVLPGSPKCYVRSEGTLFSLAPRGAKASLRCDRIPGHVLTGCSVSRGGDGSPVDGVFPFHVRYGPERPYRCIARNRGGGSGMEAHAFCCQGGNMNCWAIRSIGQGGEVVASCPDHSVLTGCSAYSNRGRVLGARAQDRACIAHKGPFARRVQAHAICCSINNR